MKPDDIWIGMNFASSSLVQTSVENAGTSEVDELSMILRWSLMEIYYSSKIENVSNLNSKFRRRNRCQFSGRNRTRSKICEIIAVTFRVCSSVSKTKQTLSSVADNATPTRGLRHESRDPNQPIANFRCISVAPEEARFSGMSQCEQFTNMSNRSTVLQYLPESRKSRLGFSVEIVLITAINLLRYAKISVSPDNSQLQIRPNQHPSNHQFIFRLDSQQTPNCCLQIAWLEGTVYLGSSWTFLSLLLVEVKEEPNLMGSHNGTQLEVINYQEDF
ncbi:hypothetical protein WN51_01837 [Melipona quadrifasciata]|uniref:Uncharacterized protein n=1 Tax=Melipona quadrifasciata TaxID=166423 RepID=A0A0N0U4N7_9HYME|nr:hypothetical protein WN51_01837 [Melipona quadrifasciata]